MMYFDKKRNRVLLRDGRSIVSSYEFAKMTLRGEDTSKVHALEGFDSTTFDLIYNRSTSSDIEDIDVSPSHHEHTDEDINAIVERIKQSPRFEEYMLNRLEHEMDFFVRTNNIKFLLCCVELIDALKRDGVVYGVGRGSMCASLILYVLEVHDINPLEYDISFSELSKEQESVI